MSDGRGWAATAFAMIALSGAPALAAPGDAPVQVAVSGVRNAEGFVTVALCTEAVWLKNCTLTAKAPAQAGTTVVTVPHVPPGRYGAIVYHDRNRNGKADRNFIGMPTEDVGFSRDAMKKLAAPKFADAVFDHGDKDQRIALTLRAF